MPDKHTELPEAAEPELARRKNYIGRNVPYSPKKVETVTPILGYKSRKKKLPPRLQNNPVL